MKKASNEKKSLMKSILKPNNLIIVTAFIMFLGIASTIGLQNQYTKLDGQIQLSPREETRSNLLEYIFIIGIIISLVILFIIQVYFSKTVKRLSISLTDSNNKLSSHISNAKNQGNDQKPLKSRR